MSRDTITKESFARINHHKQKFLLGKKTSENIGFARKRITKYVVFIRKSHHRMETLLGVNVTNIKASPN